MGRAGDGRCGACLALPDDLAAHHPERDPARPDADARGDGRDRRRAALGNRLRASRQHRSPGDPPRCANGREAAVQGNPAPLRDVTFRLRQGAQRGLLSHPRPRLRSLPVRSRPAPRYRRYLHLLRPLPERDVPLNEVHRFIDEAHESSLRVGDLIKLLREPVDRSFKPTEPREPKLGVGEPVLVTEDLSVVYPSSSREKRPALNSVSMVIRHGETIGVAGRSGCGKTTWLRTMLRLVHPTAGTALIGGVPLESISREAIGRLIGYVGQNPFVFSGSIAANIAY